jgi:Sulfotransferase family
MRDLVRFVKDIATPPYLNVKSTFTIDIGRDWRNSVFLSSGARTGSTWVAELINYNNEYRFMYEPSLSRPLLPRNHAQTAYDRRILYIRPDERDADLREQALQVLDGRFHDARTDQYNRRLVSRRRLVKEVTSNLFIRWLASSFPGLPIILLLRHPMPTVRSRAYEYFQAEAIGRRLIDMDPAGRTRDYLRLIFGQTDLVKDHLEPMRDVLESAQTVWEQRIAVWCVQNHVPLRQFQPGTIHLAFYENFCVDPQSELRRLFGFLGRPVDDAALARIRIPSQSMQHGGITQMPDGWEVVSRWRKKVNDEEMESALRILRAFGLDTVYGSEPMPDVGAAYALLGRAAG